MIGIIRQILELDKFHGVSKELDIAKGVNQLPTSIRQIKLGLDQRKRRKAWQLKR